MKLFFISLITLTCVIAPAVYAEGAIGPAERLQELQQRRGSTVSDDQRPVAIGRCNQGKQQVGSIQKASDNAVKKRLAIYGSIQKEIKAIELRMTKQGADASEIDLLIGKLQQDIDGFSEKARYSQQLAEDIATIDCAAHPEYYQAAAEEYVVIRSELYSVATDLKRTVTESPEKTFGPLIDRLRI